MRTCTLRLLSLALLAASSIPPAASADTSNRCGQQPNLACANGAQTANQDVSTIHNYTGTLSPLTFDGTTTDSAKITLSLSQDPTSSFTFTVPGDAASAAGKAASCAGGQHVSAFSAATGAYTCSADSGGTPAWSSLTNPSTNLSLSMGANTTTFTWGATTGSAVDLLTLTDTASNTGTGYVLNLHTAASSAAKPIAITAGGTSNGVEMTTAGLLQAKGTGGIKATDVAAGGLSHTLTWNEVCTASPCTLAGTPRTADTLLAFWRTSKLRRVTACGGVNEYTLSSTTFTLCDSTGIGSGADGVQVTYEL